MYIIEMSRNQDQIMCIRITPDGKITKVTQQQEEEETKNRVYYGYALSRSEHWDHGRNFRLTMAMLDLCPEGDQLNILATVLFRRLRYKDQEPDDAIFGTVYIANESEDKIIEFTMDH